MVNCGAVKADNLVSRADVEQCGLGRFPTFELFCCWGEILGVKFLFLFSITGDFFVWGWRLELELAAKFLFWILGEFFFFED